MGTEVGAEVEVTSQVVEEGDSLSDGEEEWLLKQQSKKKTSEELRPKSLELPGLVELTKGCLQLCVGLRLHFSQQ